MKNSVQESTNFKFYSLERIKKEKAHYNIIFGERSNGKTYAVLEECIQRFFAEGVQFAYVRRFADDVKKDQLNAVFKWLIEHGKVEKYSNGQYNTIYAQGKVFYCAYYDSEKGKITEKSLAFGHVFSVATYERTKGGGYPNIKTIVFDEFMTRLFYIPQEFVMFSNLVSTIVRLENDITIYLLGNTVNKFCPYFAEFGLKNIKKMEVGDLDVYRYGNSDLKVAVEYCSNNVKENKKSNVYFAFNNPKLEMITSGAWEIDNYKRLPSCTRYTALDIQYTFYILFDDEVIQGEVIYINSVRLILFSVVTDLVTDEEIKSKRVYAFEHDTIHQDNKYNLFVITDIADKKINDILKTEDVYFNDNVVGELYTNYKKLCLVKKDIKR